MGRGGGKRGQAPRHPHRHPHQKKEHSPSGRGGQSERARPSPERGVLLFWVGVGVVVGWVGGWVARKNGRV